MLYARREHGTPNGSTAFLLSVFVLQRFLTSQPQNTQAPLLPEGETQTGKLPYRTEASMYTFQLSPVQRVSSFWKREETKTKSVYEGKTPLFAVVYSLFSSSFEERSGVS